MDNYLLENFNLFYKEDFYPKFVSFDKKRTITFLKLAISYIFLILLLFLLYAIFFNFLLLPLLNATHYLNSKNIRIAIKNFATIIIFFISLELYSKFSNKCEIICDAIINRNSNENLTDYNKLAKVELLNIILNKFGKFKIDVCNTKISYLSKTKCKTLKQFNNLFLDVFNKKVNKIAQKEKISGYRKKHFTIYSGKFYFGFTKKIQGIIITIDLTKNFFKKAFLLEKNSRNTKFINQFYKNKLQNIKIGKLNYKYYSDNISDLNKYLNEDAIIKIKKTKKIFNAKNLDIIFVDGFLHIIINGSNFSNILTGINNKYHVKKFYEQFDTIISLIDEFSN